MQILGIDPIPAAIIIALIAVGLRTWWGMTDKQVRDFNARAFTQTVVIGLLVALVTVSGNIEIFPSGASEIQQLMFVISQISAIIGIDLAVKQGKKKFSKKSNSSAKLNDDDDDDSFEDMVEDLPDEAPPIDRGEEVRAR